MTRSKFLQRNGRLCGFILTGHAGSAEAGQNLVCAAVSSAAYMTANTITDVCHCAADIEERDGHLALRLSSEEAERCQTILEGFRLHMQALREQYPQHITIELTEVSF